ncbi:MAG: tetratricopeptide repeat protein [Acidiferrobacterales bacterium]|nr:tetratricopeptide repeat protein [Acidiferrobacterales bacterium]
MTTEEERLDQIKEWWKEYRWTIVAGTVLGIGVIGGWTGWNEYTRVQQESASVLYQDVSVAVVQNDYEAALTAAEQLLDEHGSSGYAGKAMLLMARASYENGDAAQARRYLRQALDEATEEATVHVARIRLAKLMIADREYQDALDLLDVERQQGFDSYYLELRGDAYHALGMDEQAHQAYLQSMDELSPGSSYEQVLALKLNETVSE